MSASSCGRVVIAGGSGFLGVSLAMHLAEAGYSIVILSRNPPKIPGPWRHVSWDARTLGDWQQDLNGAAAVVNLVGRSVDCIKTPAHQDEILRSRVEATQVLGKAMRLIDQPPPVWMQMSTAHIVDDPPQIVCHEDSPSPNPVSQRRFMVELRHALHIPFGLPAFAWIVRVGAPLLLRTDPELALYSRYVVSKRLANEGFEFCFSKLAEALADTLKPAQF